MCRSDDNIQITVKGLPGGDSELFFWAVPCQPYVQYFINPLVCDGIVSRILESFTVHVDRSGSGNYSTKESTLKQRWLQYGALNFIVRLVHDDVGEGASVALNTES